MKRNLAIVMTLLLSMTMWAQEGKQAVGFQVGFAETDYRLNAYSTLDEKAKTKLNRSALDGLKLGIVYEAGYWKGMGMMMGLNYTFGAANKKTNTVEGFNGNYSTDLWTKTTSIYHQMEIFVDWQYKFEIAKNTYVILYSGPTIQCNMVYKKNLTEHTPLLEVEKQVNMMDDLKRINVTWGVGAGFQYERYFLRGGYDFGLMNPYRAVDFGEGTYYTRGRQDQWQIKLGMFLWQNE